MSSGDLKNEDLTLGEGFSPEARLLWDMPGLPEQASGNNFSYARHRSIVSITEGLTRAHLDPEFFPYPQRPNWDNATEMEAINYTADCIVVDLKRRKMPDQVALIEQGASFYRQLTDELGSTTRVESLIGGFMEELQAFAKSGQVQPDPNRVLKDLSHQTVQKTGLGNTETEFKLSSFFHAMWELTKGEWWKSILSSES